MCFSVPYKILKIEDDFIVVEGEKIVRIDKKIDMKKYGYVQVVGNVAVSALSKTEGLKIRKLIKRLN